MATIRDKMGHRSFATAATAVSADAVGPSTRAAQVATDAVEVIGQLGDQPADFRQVAVEVADRSRSDGEHVAGLPRQGITSSRPTWRATEDSLHEPTLFV
jgi:hypothetical protein